MKRKNKITLGIVGLATVALFASGCTANFCTDLEKSRIAYAFEPGVSQFVVVGTEYENNDIMIEESVGENVHQIIRGTIGEGVYNYYNSAQLNSVISSAQSSAVAIPNIDYFKKLDKVVFDLAIAEYNAKNEADKIDLSVAVPDDQKVNLQAKLDKALNDYGYLKFYGDGKTFENFYKINRDLRNKYDYISTASIDFENFYISSMSTLIESYRSSITVYNQFKYGNYNGKQIQLEGVTWKQAWGKGGHLIEGLIVYPVAWMIDAFAYTFAEGKNATTEAIQAQYLTGGPQILSILVVTVIVRMFIFLVTIKSTLSQKKMTDLQPELAKIQQKYPNANTNQAQKQRLAEEQMRLYKKHKVNPLSQLLVLVIQFPIFIGVWGAMTGSAVLSTGTFLNLDLSGSIWAALKVGPKAHMGWWTALVLILLMSAGQFFAMKVPQWIQKAKTKKVARLGKNPAQKQQNRTANIVSYVMLIMIIVMGFTLPAAMGVYWFVGAIVSLIQTLFTNVIFAGGKKKK